MARRHLAGTSFGVAVVALLFAARVDSQTSQEALDAGGWESRADTRVAVTGPEELGRCRKLAGALRHSDTLIVEGLGLSVAQRLWPASSDEYRQAAEGRRVLSYRLRELGRRSPDVTSDEGANRYLVLLAAHRTEQETLVANLVAAGVDPSPPAGWTDPAF